MIKEVTMYRIECDVCGKNPESEYHAWSDVSGAEEEAYGSDWEFDVQGIRHVCPNCYEYDDDDNLVIKTREGKP